MNGYSNASHDDQRECLLELEKIFKQNIFTRDEVDHLTKLLHSRSRDVFSGIKEERPVTSKEIVQTRKDILTSSIGQRNVIESNTHNKNLLTPSPSMKIMEDITSPAELAKAYMSSRPSKIPPSTTGLRRQIFKGEVTPFRNPIFASKFCRTPSSSKSSTIVTGAISPMIPRFHGRSAIYNMARTPYSRVRPVNVLKGSSPVADIGEGPSSSQNTWEPNYHSKYKQTLKRRSSVLDDDDGVPSSVPLRRTRQKQNLVIENSVPHNSGSTFARGSNYCNDANSLPSTSRYSLLNGSVKQEDYNVSRGMNLFSVPSQSTETAAKILQHLEKLVPSPKERIPELKITAGAGPSTMLTKNIFKGNDVKIFKSEDGVKSEQAVTNVPLCHGKNASLLNGDSSKTDGIDKNAILVCSSPSEITMAVDSKYPVGNSGSVEVTKPVIPAFSVQAHKKRSFKMSAHEDYIDLDEDIKGTSSSLLSAKAEPDSNGVAESRSLPPTSDLPKLEPPAKVKRLSSSVFSKFSDPESTVTSTDVEREDVFSFQNVSYQSMPSNAASSEAVKPSFVLPSPLPPSEISIPSLNDIPSRTTDASSSFSFSSPVARSNLLVEVPTSTCTAEPASADEPKSAPAGICTPPPETAPPPSKNGSLHPAPPPVVPPPAPTTVELTLPPLPPAATNPPTTASTISAATSTSRSSLFSSPPLFPTTATPANPFSGAHSPSPAPLFPSAAPSNPFSSSSSSPTTPIFGAAPPVNPFSSSTPAAGTANPATPLTTTATAVPPATTTFAGFSTGGSAGGGQVSAVNPFRFEPPKANPFALPPTVSEKETTDVSVAPIPGSGSGSMFSSAGLPPNGPSLPLFGSSTATSLGIFSFGSSPATGSNSASHSSSGGGIFGTKPSLFGPSTGFSFGQRPELPPAATPATSPAAFGSGTGGFLFSSSATAAAASSAPGFCSGPGDNMEDSMAEDSVAEMVGPTTPPPATPVVFPPPSGPGFTFGATPPTAMGGSVFQFGGVGQASGPSPFQASGKLGDFTIGSGGGGGSGVDKSNRRFVKVKHRAQRRK